MGICKESLDVATARISSYIIYTYTLQITTTEEGREAGVEILFTILDRK